MVCKPSKRLISFVPSKPLDLRWESCGSWAKADWTDHWSAKDQDFELDGIFETDFLDPFTERTRHLFYPPHLADLSRLLSAILASIARQNEFWIVWTLQVWEHHVAGLQKLVYFWLWALVIVSETYLVVIRISVETSVLSLAYCNQNAHIWRKTHVVLWVEQVMAPCVFFVWAYSSSTLNNSRWTTFGKFTG